MEKFYLDLTDDGRWLIIRGKERYVAGRDKGVAVKLIARLNAAKKASVYQVIGGNLYVCWDINREWKDWVCEIINHTEDEKRPI